MRKTLCAIASIVLACGTAAAAEPTIDTYAGGGTAIGNGDGGQARQARLNDLRDITFDKAGNLYLAEVCYIRKITPAGIITTIGGNGTNSATPANGAPATSGAICSNTVAADPFGNVWTVSLSRIGKIDAAGKFTYVAGTGVSGYSGDGGPATSAKISSVVRDIVFDAIGNAYISDGNRIRRISTNGIITTFAGIGAVADGGDAGDGGLATLARVDPEEMAIDKAGNLFFVDGYYNGVRRIDTTGTIARIWGGFPRYRSDPVAVYADDWFPAGLATDDNGNLYVSNLRDYVSIISPNNTITYAAVGVFNDTTFDDGPSSSGFGGDGGPVSLAKIHDPVALAFDAQGNLFIADAGNARIRKVTGAFDPPPPVPAGMWRFKHATTQRLESQNQYTVGIVKGRSNADDLTDLFVLAGAWIQGQPYPGDYNLYAYRQNPDGTMAAPLATPVPVMELTDVMAIDLNQDRYTDIVFSGYHFGTEPECVYVMLGSASGLRAPVAYTGINGGNGAHYLDQADMDGDGNMDVLAYLSTGGSGVGTFADWAVYYGNGAGQLVRKKLTSIAPGGRGVIRDLNGDHRPDLLVSWRNQVDSGLAVAYHDGVDSFLPLTYFRSFEPDKAGYWPVAGDFDNDGRLDIITSFDENAPRAKLAQWTQTANNDFVFVREWATYDSPQAMIATDMNGDGLDDLLVKHSGWSAIGYHEQKRLAGNTFGLERELKSYMSVYNQSTTHSIVVGDFNNDQCLDIAGSGTNSGLQIIYSTRCQKTKPGANPPRPPARPGTNPTATQTATPVSAATVTNQGVWVASQKVARMAWASTVGAWSDTARWIGAGVSLLLFGWWLLPASALGRRRA